MRRFLTTAMCLAAVSGSGQSREAPGPSVDCVTVTLVQRAQMSDAETDTVRDQLTAIWRQGDVDVIVRSGDAPSGEGRLRLVLTDAPVHGTGAPATLCTLGVITFVDGRPDPQLTVSVTAARDWVRRAHPEVLPAVQTLMAARIVGRAAAHELGHYLLADPGHRRSGLMRARFDDVDLLGGRLESFAPPTRTEVAAGLSRAAGECSCGCQATGGIVWPAPARLTFQTRPTA